MVSIGHSYLQNSQRQRLWGPLGQPAQCLPYMIRLFLSCLSSRLNSASWLWSVLPRASVTGEPALPRTPRGIPTPHFSGFPGHTRTLGSALWYLQILGNSISRIGAGKNLWLSVEINHTAISVRLCLSCTGRTSELESRTSTSSHSVWFPPHSKRLAFFSISVLHMRKLRLREVKSKAL